jgi:hypothetical protein
MLPRFGQTAPGDVTDPPSFKHTHALSMDHGGGVAYIDEVALGIVVEDAPPVKNLRSRQVSL